MHCIEIDGQFVRSPGDTDSGREKDDSSIPASCCGRIRCESPCRQLPWPEGSAAMRSTRWQQRRPNSRFSTHARGELQRRLRPNQPCSPPRRIKGMCPSHCCLHNQHKQNLISTYTVHTGAVAPPTISSRNFGGRSQISHKLFSFSCKRRHYVAHYAQAADHVVGYKK